MYDKAGADKKTDDYAKSTPIINFLKRMQLEKLGPGQYNYELSTLSGPSCHFPSSKRFSRYQSPILRPQLTFDDPKRRQEIFDENKDVTKYSPAKRLKLLREKAAIESAKNLNIKEKKQEMYKTQKSERIMKIKDKEKKYE